jgi:hypothetical protein
MNKKKQIDKITKLLACSDNDSDYIIELANKFNVSLKKCIKYAQTNKVYIENINNIINAVYISCINKCARKLKIKYVDCNRIKIDCDYNYSELYFIIKESKILKHNCRFNSDKAKITDIETDIVIYNYQDCLNALKYIEIKETEISERLIKIKEELMKELGCAKTPIRRKECGET